MSSITYTIDLRGGHGSNRHALERYTRLERLLSDVIAMFRHELLYEYAQLLSDWRRSLRWRIREQSHWTLELDDDEWKALSRGLRSISNYEGSTMYQWLNLQKVQDDGR